jgi:hypothetical protein
MDIKNLISKIDGKKVLSIGVTVLGVAGTLLSTKVDSNNRETLKAQLKEELIQELSKKK